MKLTCRVLLGLTVVCSATGAQGLTVGVPVYEVPEENAFDYYLRATELFPEDKPWDDMATALEGADPAEVQRAVDAGLDALEEMRQGIDKPCVMPGGVTFDTLFPYLGGFRSLTRLLLCEGYVHRANGDIDLAFRSYRDALKLGQDTARNGVLIHKLVSIAIESMACKGIRTAMPDAAGAPEALAGLIAYLAALEKGEVPLAETLAIEYDATRRSLEQYRDDPQARDTITELLGQPKLEVSVGMLDEATEQLEPYFAQLIAVARMDYRRWNQALPEPPRGNPLVEAIVPMVGKMRAKDARHVADLRGTLVVVGLEAHLAATGEYPGSLEQLVPDILAELPVDPFCGEGFRYERVSELEYRLYSLGPNMVDDGGVQEHAGDEEHDLVFYTWE